MGSHVYDYSIRTDTFHLAYMPEDDFPGTQPEGTYSNGELVPEGPWTAFVSPYAIQGNGGIGLTLQLQSGELLELIAHPTPPADAVGVMFVPFPGRPMTLRVEHDEGILVYSYSEDLLDWTEVASFSPDSPVVEVGVVLRYDREEYSAGGQAGQPRLLAGIWENVVEEIWLAEPDPVATTREAPPQAATVSSTSEPPVHVIVGAQFGDLEFDVGKSVRWVTWFCDNVFVLDVNLGTQRYWVVNWAQTFPDAEHSVTGINYFVLPTEFRKEQWKQYKLAFGEPNAEDWILWLDGSEGLNVDNRSLPNDYAFAPFKSFLWREIQRAEDAGQNYAVLPNYVFLRSDDTVNVTYETNVDSAGMDIGPLQAISTPYYLVNQGLKRLWKASELMKPDFDWTQLDTSVPYDIKAGSGVAASAAYLNPEVGQVSTPNQASFNLVNGTKYRLSYKGKFDQALYSYIYFAYKGDATRSYLLGTVTGNNHYYMTTQNEYVMMTAPVSYGVDHTIGVEFTPGATAAVEIFDGVRTNRTWGAAPVIQNNSDPVRVGDASYRGRLDWAKLEQLDAGGNVVATIWKFDPAERTGTGTTYTDPRGHVWTLTNANAIVPAVAAVPAEPAAKIAIVSYAYAHWNLQDIEPPATEVPPLTADNDDGYRMRQLMSRVRPVQGIPVSDSWIPPSSDPAGFPGPWSPADANNPDPIDPTTGDPLPQPVTPHSSLLGLVTPLYDNAFRINMRDGVWYEEGRSGNIPLKWDEASQTWTTDYDPAEWAGHGVKSYDPTAVPTPDPVP